jgi:hypothetical protein
MAIFYNTSIVRNGLVMNLDAANKKSYNTATSTSTWIDVSGSGNVLSLTNSPTYNGTSFNFNGTGYATTSSNLITGLASSSTEFSVSVWFNYVNTTSYTAVFEKQSGVGGAIPRMDIGYGATQFYWTGWYQPTAAVHDLVLTTPIVAGAWYHTVLTCTSSTKTVYINGVFAATANVATSWPDASQPLGVGGKLRPMNGSVPVVQIYNRALTANEVQQNFQAQRDRFGI